MLYLEYYTSSIYRMLALIKREEIWQASSVLSALAVEWTVVYEVIDWSTISKGENLILSQWQLVKSFF